MIQNLSSSTETYSSFVTVEPVFSFIHRVELVIPLPMLPFTPHVPCLWLSLLLPGRRNTNGRLVLDHDSTKWRTSVEFLRTMIMGTASDGRNVSAVPIHSVTLKVGQ